MTRWIALVGLLAWLGLPCPAPACKFCCWSKTPTLRQEAVQASMILYGTVANPRPPRADQATPFDDATSGTTDFFIEEVLKSHPILGGRKQIELPRYVAIDPQGPNRYLIYFDVHKGQIDPYRGFLASPEIVAYLRGMLALGPKDQRQVLAHAFRHLEHTDPEIAKDAFNEFSYAEYKDYRELARTLRPDVLARWLQDADVPPYRVGLYALLLGHCGTDEHAPLLRRLCREFGNEGKSGLDQVLVGGTVLRPREGWRQTYDILKDPEKDFMSRYAAFRAIQFFWNERPALVPRSELLAALERLLDQSDMADLVIESLRRWHRWDLAGRVIGLHEKQAHGQVPIVRRAVLRYALCCPLPEAASFLGEMRQLDPEKVKEAEEALKLEADETPPPGPRS